MNRTIIDRRIRFEATEVTVPIVSLSICPKPQITNPTKAISPTRPASNIGWKILIRCQPAVMIIPASVATVVASKIGINTSVGCTAPYELRKARIVVGMIVKPEVFSTKNIIIGLVAVSFLVFNSCICPIAFNPVGVAALSSPNIFDAIFIKIDPITGWFLGISGKSLEKKGLSIRARTLTTPALSPIFIIPNHNANTPVKPNDVSKAVLDESKVESTIFWNIVVSPINREIIPKTKAIRKNPIQI